MGEGVSYFASSHPNKSLSSEKIESQVARVRGKMTKLLSDFSLPKYKSHELLWEAMDSLRSSNFDLLVYQGFELVAWNSQMIPVEGINPQYFKNPLVRLDNGWYLTSYIESDDVLMVAFSLLKHGYNYQNAFLKDAFSPQYKLDPSVVISQDEGHSDLVIKDERGNFLFGLLVNGIESQPSTLINWGGSILLLSWVFFWFLLFFIQEESQNNKLINGVLFASSILFFGYSYYLFWFRSLFPNLFPELFSPLYFAMSAGLPSIGHFFIFAFLLFTWAFWIYKFFKFPRNIFSGKQSLIYRYVLLFLCLIGSVVYLIYLNHLFYLLAKHSSGTIVITKIVELDGIAFLKMGMIALLLLSFVFLLERILIQFLWSFSRRQILFSIIMVSFLSMIVYRGVGVDESDWIFLFYLGVSVVLIFARRNADFSLSYLSYLWLCGLFGVYVGATMLDLSIRKEESNRELLVENLAFQLVRDEDPVAEMYLAELENQLANDVTLIRMLAQPELNSESIRNHLIKFYFYGYWGRYDLQIIPCWPKGNVYLESHDKIENCYSYFYSLLETSGHNISGSKHFHYLDQSNGNISFFGVFRFFPNDPVNETSLFIELHSKPFFEGLGYPELLVNRREQARMKLLEGYSYAKYVNGRLVKRSGSYNYKPDLSLYNSGVSGKVFIKERGYSHLVYHLNSNFAVVLSSKDYSLNDVFISFSIFFLFFFALGGLGIFFLQWYRSGFVFQISIQKRIQAAFVLLMLVMLVVVAIGTVYYTVKQFERKHFELLENKIQSVLLELEYKIGYDGPETYIPEEYLNYQLQMLSNVFYCDINLFGVDGKLIGTSRPELYKSGLSGFQMNPDAYFQLAYTESENHISDEKIGSMEYLSFYVPFLNSENNLAGFVNLPYFVGNNELEDEVSAVIVTIVNFYLVFSFLVIGLAVFLARQITRPLLMLQSKISKVKLGHLNEKIDYKKNDEIGELVIEYNRMVDELSDSAEKLAKNERELAWREMAKQIAHEIKNPLTPMKLNIQYLQRAWNDGADNFGSYLKRVSTSLIEQINSLSNIASEFSKFAQMPTSRAEKVNLIEKIENVVVLYANSEGVILTFTNETQSVVYVKSDGEQLLSVFNNLIKNAIQAGIPGEDVQVDVKVSWADGFVRIVVCDNGKGIPEDIQEKLFVPSFTTKTGGMGLGLAIVRRIVENAGGNIWFESNAGGGTSFIVDLPYISDLSESSSPE